MPGVIVGLPARLVLISTDVDADSRPDMLWLGADKTQKHVVRLEPDIAGTVAHGKVNH